MSILINGLEMPKDGCHHMICVYTDGTVSTGGRVYMATPVPAHGDLIDRDALTDAIESTDWYHQAPNKEMVHGANSAEHQAWYKEQDIYSAIEDAPTVIPAEKECGGDD